MVNTIFELLICIIEDGTALLFMSLYLGWKYKGAIRILGYIGATAASVTLITYLNSLMLNEGLYALLFVLIYLVYAFLFLKGDIYNKMFIACFTNALMYFVPNFTSIAVTSIFKDVNLYEPGLERTLAVIVSKILLILACILLLKYKRSNTNSKSKLKIAAVLPFVSLLSTIGLITVFFETDLSNELLFTMIAVFFANSLIFYAFLKISTDMEKESEANVLLQKYELDRKHAVEVEELYSKTCSIRHDMVNHLETVASLIEKDGVKALEYIESVTKNQISGIRSFVRTGNDTFDAVINSKVALCDKKEIKVQVRVMNHSLDRLKSHEIGIIFGNLFDNAIEACEKAREKRIELDVQIQGNRTSIVMKNTVEKSVLGENSELKTTKKDSAIHGFGIRNIRNIVEEYGGMMNFFEEDGFFGCDILI